MQTVVNQVVQWATYHGFKFSPSMTMAMYFHKRKVSSFPLFRSKLVIFCRRGTVRGYNFRLKGYVGASHWTVKGKGYKKHFAFCGFFLTCLGMQTALRFCDFSECLFIANLTMDVRLIHLQVPLFFGSWTLNSQNLYRGFPLTTSTQTEGLRYLPFTITCSLAQHSAHFPALLSILLPHYIHVQLHHNTVPEHINQLVAASAPVRQAITLWQYIITISFMVEP